MRSSKRYPWQDERDGSFSAGSVVLLLCIAILAAGALGFWFNDMYASHYGIFGK